MSELFTLMAGAIFTGLLLLVGHWFPWVRGLDKLQSYTYGVLAIWAGFTLWRTLNGDWLTAAGLLAIAGVGGLATWGAYQLDARALRIRQAKRGTDAETALKRATMEQD